MSPNGLNAPPAFAATTMLMQASATKRGASAPDRHDDGAHHQRGRQIVGDRREEEGERAGQPEQRPVAEAGAHQPGAQHVEDAPLLKRVDVGHRDDQEEQQLGIFEEHMAEGRLYRLRGAKPEATSATSPQISPAATTTGFDLRRWIASSPITRIRRRRRSPAPRSRPSDASGPAMRPRLRRAPRRGQEP